MKKILYICNSVPGDISSGSAQRTTYLYQTLCKMGEVYTVILVKKTHEQHLDSHKKIAWICVNQGNWIGKLIHQFVKQFSLVLDYSWHGLKKYLPTEWQSHSFDFTVTRYTRIAALARPWNIADSYLDIDDLPTESLQTIYHDRSLLKLRLKFVNWYSNRIFQKMKGLWLANSTQLARLPHHSKTTLQNIPQAPIREPNPDAPQQKHLLFIGNMAYRPNYEGIDHFLYYIWPGILQNNPEITVHIGGRGLKQELKERWEKIPRVVLLDFVEKIEQAYSDALFCIAPIYSGSGTCIKVLEAMRMGRICLCNHFAARGLDFPNLTNNGLIIAKDDCDFTTKAIQLIQNNALRKDLQSKTVNAVYSFANQDTFDQSVRSLLP